MLKIILYPSWIMSKFIILFLPKTHPWYKQKFSLTDWCERSTDLNYHFSVTMWMYLILFIIGSFLF